LQCSTIPGVGLPSAKLELRPGFDLTVLANVTARDLFIEHLTWFGQLHAAEKAVSILLLNVG
jgi:hypothetical protein